MSRLDFDRDGADWPHRDASRFVRAAGMRWHVQVAGTGPAILLVHGTGAASHSWRGSFATLAARFQVVAPDLPGHAFTEPPPRDEYGTASMALQLEALLAALGVRPHLAIGHSAGAALLARMALDGRLAAAAIASVNGALREPMGFSWRLFGPAARLLASTSLAAHAVSAIADPHRVGRMAESTGSTLDAQGIDLYSRLAASPGHVGAVLAMMAQWDLPGVERDLPKLATPLELAVGEGDLAVPAAEADRIRKLVPGPAPCRWPRLGHLAHEEAPQAFLAWIDEVLARHPPGVPA